MRFKCNCCGKWPQAHVFESDVGTCDRCGAHGLPHVALLCEVHFIVMDPKGAIDSIHGRQYVACEPNRPYLALMGGPHYAATPDPRIATCPSCRGTRQWKEAAAQYEELAQAVGRRGPTTVDMKTCCG